MNPKNPEQSLNSQVPMHETRSWKRACSKAGLFLSEKPFLASFLAALFLVVPILLVFRVYFQLNDDNFVLFLLKGVGLNWTPSELTQLENVLLCVILKSLYVHFPTIQWYSGFLVLCEFLSLWGILASFQMGTHGFFKTFLFLLGTAAFSVHLFTDLQWTLTAASAAIGGFMLLAATWRREDSKYLYPAISLAFVLILLSVLIRNSSLLLVGLASVPAVIYLSWKVRMTAHRRTILWFLVTITVLSLGAIAFNNTRYDRYAAWRDSTRFLTQHNELEDFRNPVYNETTKPVFDSIGWTELDLGLFRNWYFMDPDTYSLEKIQKLNDYFPHFAFDKDPQDSFGDMFSYLPTELLVMFFLALLPFLPKRAFRFMGLNLVWTFLVLGFCLLYLKMPQRIYLPCLFLQNNLAVLWAVPKKLGPGENKKSSPWVPKLGMVFVILMSIFTLYILSTEYGINRDWSSQEQELKSAMGDLNPQDNQLFVAWGSTFPFEKIGAFDDDEFMRHFHFVSLSWIQRAPPTQAMLDHFGIKNLFKDLVDNPNVFLICTPHQWYLYRDYMKEKYNMEVYVKIPFQSASFSAFSVQSTKPDQTAPQKKE